MDESGRILTTSPQKESKSKRIRLRIPSSFLAPAAAFFSSSPLQEDQDDSSFTESETDTSVISEQTLKTRYEAESPDELALVKAACSYGCRLLRRAGNIVTVWLPAEGEVDIELLHVLQFDAIRKRMSVIIRHPFTQEIILYCKGADSAVLSNLHRPQSDYENSEILQKTQEHITIYSKEGLRTLCMAKKVVKESEYTAWLEQHHRAEAAFEHQERAVYESACNIETDLTLLGCTGIEDCLQDGVSETISDLRAAGIKVWVLTGDKQETAMNIAYSCNLISFDQHLLALNARSKDMTKELLENRIEQLRLLNGGCHDNHAMEDVRAASWISGDVPDVTVTGHAEFSHVQEARTNSSAPCTRRRRGKPNVRQQQQGTALVVDGKTLGFIFDQKLEESFLSLAKQCDSVLCCRTTPFQKAAVVKLARDKLKKLTLAIGDGANDVSMIQTADVGVGISGQEGMQAVMASDFAIPRFRFLRRLLLVHGHWCYDRLARVALYMFYKNAIFIFLLMWYQIYNGFSGASQVEQYNLIFFNLLYTSLPPIMLGIWDKDLPDSMLLSQPHLYKQGPAGRIYQHKSYWFNIVDAVWQSLALYFVAHLAYRGSSADIWEFGYTCLVISVLAALLHLCIEMKSWNPVILGSVGLSLLVMLVFNLAYSAACVSCSSAQSPYMVVQHAMTTAQHWLVCLLGVCLALAPRYIGRILQNTFAPSAVELARQELRLHRSGNSTFSALTPGVTSVKYTPHIEQFM